MIGKNHTLSVDINNLCDEDIPDQRSFEKWLNCALANVNHYLVSEYSLFELSVNMSFCCFTTGQYLIQKLL